MPRRSSLALMATKVLLSAIESTGKESRTNLLYWDFSNGQSGCDDAAAGGAMAEVKTQPRPMPKNDGDKGIVQDQMVNDLYRKMLTVYYIEERMKIFTRQGKCSFHASTRGHEKIQVGITMLMRPRHDWFFTYYREKGIAVALGMPIKD